MLYAYHLNNPSRPLDWRFRLVLEVLRNRKPWGDSHNDDQMRAAYRFLKCHDSAKTEAEKEALFRKPRGLAYAYQLHTNRGSPETTLAIEARILARQSDQEIATKIGILPETVYWYEALFFCVRDRLDCTDYIFAKIQKQASCDDVTQREITIKLLGYCGGPVVVNHALEGFNDEDRPTDPADLPAYNDVVQKVNLRLNALIATRNMKVDAHNAMQLLARHCRMMRADRKASSADETPETLKAVDDLLAGLQRAIGLGT